MLTMFACTALTYHYIICSVFNVTNIFVKTTVNKGICDGNQTLCQWFKIKSDHFSPNTEHNLLHCYSVFRPIIPKCLIAKLHCFCCDNWQHYCDTCACRAVHVCVSSRCQTVRSAEHLIIRGQQPVTIHEAAHCSRLKSSPL